MHVLCAHRTYWAVISDSPNGSYDLIIPKLVLHVLQHALLKDETSGTASVSRPGYLTDVTSKVEVLSGDEESPMLQDYGSYRAGVQGNPTGW